MRLITGDLALYRVRVWQSIKKSGIILHILMSRRANLLLLNKSLGRRVISDWRTGTELEAGYLVHLDYISSGLTEARGNRDPIECITAIDILVMHGTIILPLTLVRTISTLIYQPQWRCQIPRPSLVFYRGMICQGI